MLYSFLSGKAEVDGLVQCRACASSYMHDSAIVFHNTNEQPCMSAVFRKKWLKVERDVSMGCEHGLRAWQAVYNLTILLVSIYLL